MPTGCEMKFEIGVSDAGATVEGLDLSLYKHEVGKDPYIVVVLFQRQESLDDVTLIEIQPECNGWQTFHINNALSTLDFSMETEQELTLKIIGYNVATISDWRNPTRMTCDEISSVFVLPEVIPPVEYSGDEGSGYEEDKTNNNNNQTLSDFLPVLTAFVKKTDSNDIQLNFNNQLKKRDTSVNKLQPTNPPETTNKCELQHKFTDLKALYPNIVSPSGNNSYINQYVCITPPSLKNKSLECFPSKYESITITVTGANNKIQNKTLQNFIITDCRLATTLGDNVCQVQNNTVDLRKTFYKGIVEPHMHDIKQCGISASVLNSDGLQCVPATYTNVTVLVEVEGEKTSAVLPAVVSSCKLIITNGFENTGSGEMDASICESAVHNDMGNALMSHNSTLIQRLIKLIMENCEPIEESQDNKLTCERQTKNVSVAEHFNDTITYPMNYDIGQCVLVSSDKSTTTECVQCIADYIRLEVLKLRTENNGTIIDQIDNAVINSCSLNYANC